MNIPKYPTHIPLTRAYRFEFIFKKYDQNAEHALAVDIPHGFLIGGLRGL